MSGAAPTMRTDVRADRIRELFELCIDLAAYGSFFYSLVLIQPIHYLASSSHSVRSLLLRPRVFILVSKQRSTK